MQVRMLAQTLRLASVEVKPGPPAIITVTFDPKAAIPEGGIRKIMDRYQRRFRLRSALSFEVQMPQPDWASVFPELTAALQTLAVCDTKKPIPSA